MRDAKKLVKLNKKTKKGGDVMVPKIGDLERWIQFKKEENKKLEKEEGRTLLFVWGTLRRGAPNHYLLQKAGAKFVGYGMPPLWFVRTDKLSIYLVGADNENTDIIQGEIYALDYAALKQFIDPLEGYINENEFTYFRAKVPIFALEEGKIYSCWIYFFV